MPSGCFSDAAYALHSRGPMNGGQKAFNLADDSSSRKKSGDKNRGENSEKWNDGAHFPWEGLHVTSAPRCRDLYLIQFRLVSRRLT